MEKLLPHSLRRNQPCQQLYFRHSASRLWDDKFLLLKPPSFMALCFGNTGKLIYWATEKLSHKQRATHQYQGPTAPLSVQGISSEDFERKQQFPLSRLTGCLYTRLPHTHTHLRTSWRILRWRHRSTWWQKGLRHLCVDPQTHNYEETARKDLS